MKMTKEQALALLREICPFTYVELHGEERDYIYSLTDMVEPDAVSMSLHIESYDYTVGDKHYQICWPIDNPSKKAAMVFELIPN